MVIFQCRYNDASQLVKKAVQSGKLGKIPSVRSTLTWYRPDSYYSESDWKGTWDKEGGGVVIDQAIHSVDLVNWIVDSEPVNVSVSMANRGHEAVVVEDSAEGLISYRNGVKYGFYCMNNYGCDEPIEIRLFCEKEKRCSVTTTRILLIRTERRKRRISGMKSFRPAARIIGGRAINGRSSSFTARA